jgi:hypothetical protein
VADGSFQAVTQDLEGADRQPICKHVQSLLDVPGGELPELKCLPAIPSAA